MNHHQLRWTAEKIAARLRLIEPLVYRHWQPLPYFDCRLLTDPNEPPPVHPGLVTDGWTMLTPGSYWAGRDQMFVLRADFSIPPDWDPAAPLALFLPLGEAGAFSHPEALVYIDGVPVGSTDRHHQEVPLEARLADGAAHTLALFGWTGNTLREGAVGRLLMRPCAVVQIDQPTRELIATARTALGVANALRDEQPEKWALLDALDTAFRALDTREPLEEGFYATVREARLALDAHIGEIESTRTPVTVFAAGHAHIDVAWLWTLAQTRRKAARTFTTVVRLMEQFPEFRFTQSQPQLYDFVRTDHPALFEKIQALVAEGRWEVIGGMWIEADCNLTGAESLARQFLLGRGFFRHFFGVGAESPVLWLPDVFGYSAALPQLIKLAGLEYFFTIKIGWNQYNRLPYDSFWWQGIDGTRVLTHFSTTPENPDSTGTQYASTYNAAATPAQIIATWRNFQQKDRAHTLLMSYGYGDGGGGPTREMLETIRRMERMPAVPQVRPGKVIEFFDRLKDESGDTLPVWNGELYLEIHRGTYTTQSRIKRANRKAEFGLHDAEFLATLAALYAEDYDYPVYELHRAWEIVCLNQFHDILPGSSIGAVYDEALKQYELAQSVADYVRDEALKALAAQMGGDVLLINPTSFPHSEIVRWENLLPQGKYLQTIDGRSVSTQKSGTGTLINTGSLPPYSITALKVVDGSETVVYGVKASSRRLENDFLRVEFNSAGDITRIYDKRFERDVLPDGAVANQFQLFEDRPVNWDAWDIDIFYDDRMWTAEPSSEMRVEYGALRASMEIKRHVHNSTITQRITLNHDSALLRFDTEIDWHERHMLLKVAFPVNILASEATHEIQWGSVARPTHRNTRWDWARFETPAQKWVDLSEGDYGVALLNDCKYGHDVRDNLLRLTLLRAPTDPDPEADQGLHRFTYGLLPHGGDWRSGGVIPAAYALNDPLMVVSGAGSGTGSAASPAASTPAGTATDSEPHSRLALLELDRPNIVVETVKAAEDGSGIIVRLYESHRARGTVTLTLGFDVRAASITNLLEEEQERLKVVEHRKITLRFQPFQIITLRLVP